MKSRAAKNTCERGSMNHNPSIKVFLKEKKNEICKCVIVETYLHVTKITYLWKWKDFFQYMQSYSLTNGIFINKYDGFRWIPSSYCSEQGLWGKGNNWLYFIFLLISLFPLEIVLEDAYTFLMPQGYVKLNIPILSLSSLQCKGNNSNFLSRIKMYNS